MLMVYVTSALTWSSMLAARYPQRGQQVFGFLRRFWGDDAAALGIAGDQQDGTGHAGQQLTPLERWHGAPKGGQELLADVDLGVCPGFEFCVSPGRRIGPAAPREPFADRYRRRRRRDPPRLWPRGGFSLI